MSPEEQKEVIGQTVMDRSALVLELATTDKQLSDLATELKALSNDIRDLIEPDQSAIRPRPTFTGFAALHKRGDFASIISLTQERVEIQKKLQIIEGRLRNMGVTN